MLVLSPSPTDASSPLRVLLERAVTLHIHGRVLEALRDLSVYVDRATAMARKERWKRSRGPAAMLIAPAAAAAQSPATDVGHMHRHLPAIPAGGIAGALVLQAVLLCRLFPPSAQRYGARGAGAHPAIAPLTTVIDTEPGCTVALYNRAIIHYRCGRPWDAIRDLGALILAEESRAATDGADTTTALSAVREQRQRRRQQVRKQHKRQQQQQQQQRGGANSGAAASSSEHHLPVSAYQLRAHIYADLAQPLAALADCDAGMRRHRDHVGLLMTRARCARMMGDAGTVPSAAKGSDNGGGSSGASGSDDDPGGLRQAVNLYTRILELEPRHPTAREMRGVCYHLMGREREAVHDLRACIDEYESRASSPASNAGLAQLHTEMALTLLAHQYRKHNLYHPGTRRLGVMATGTAEKTGKAGKTALPTLPAAHQHATQAVKLAPRQWRAFAVRAEVNLCLGNLTGAVCAVFEKREKKKERKL
jgi:hypothetical protein